MSKKSEANLPVPEDFSTLSYEEALERLEGVVAGMEDGELSLEKLISHYEEGMRLRKVCMDKLAEAEVKIKALEATLEGEYSLKPLTLGEDSE